MAKTANTGLYESNQLDPKDCERLRAIFRKIISEGRITHEVEPFADDTNYAKTKE